VLSTALQWYTRPYMASPDLLQSNFPNRPPLNRHHPYEANLVNVMLRGNEALEGWSCDTPDQALSLESPGYPSPTLSGSWTALNEAP
jgi:hypothetical protein